MSRVVMLTCQFMPDVFGGAEKQCQRVSNELAARGHDVTVLTSTQVWAMSGTRMEGTVRVRRIFTPIAPDLLGRWLAFSAYWFVLALLWCWRHRSSFDLLHCHQGKFGGFAGVMIGRLLRKPVLIKIGNSEPDMDLQCLQRKFLVGAPMADYVVDQRPLFVAISKVIAQNLRSFGCRDVIEIPNGIPALTIQAKPDPRSSADAPSFFFHGRIESIKRVDVLLQAFASALPDLPGARLHIIGDGADLPAMKVLATELALGERVHFHGQAIEVLATIRDFDVFVNASRAEGFSNSLLEALALGKVLVSTPVSGAAEAIVDGSNGYLAKDFSVDALAQAVRAAWKLADGPHREVVATVSRKLIEERYDMSVVVQQYEGLYQKLVTEH